MFVSLAHTRKALTNGSNFLFKEKRLCPLQGPGGRCPGRSQVKGFKTVLVPRTGKSWDGQVCVQETDLPLSNSQPGTNLQGEGSRGQWLCY